MTDFTIRSDSVDVEQIMGRIRARIREKRGVDYTEQDLKELAAVKLEKFLDPEGVRSDLLAEFKKASRPPVAPVPPPQPPLEPLSEPPPSYVFEDYTIYETHRTLLRWARRLFNPLLKLLFNPNPLIKAINDQTKINAHYARIEAEMTKRAYDTERRTYDTAKRAYDMDRHRADREILTYEVLHNLVVELTRAGIEIKNLKMRVESLSSRLDFDERRARALETVVEYRKDTAPPHGAPPAAAEVETPSDITGERPAHPAQAPATGEALRSGRRRRRRGRRGGRRSGPGLPGGEPGPAPTPGAPPQAVSGAPETADAREDGPAPYPAEPAAADADASRSDIPDHREDHEAKDPGDR